MPITERDIRSEVTTLMTKIPKFLDKQNSTHLTVFGYIKECLRVYRKCISVNFLDVNSLESLSIDYYSCINCIYATDKVLFGVSIKYLQIISNSLMTILEKNQLYESCKNLLWVLEIIDDDNIKNIS